MHDAIVENVDGVHVADEILDEGIVRKFLHEGLEHVAAHALALDRLLLPEAPEVIGGEGELLEGDGLILANLVVVNLALELVRVDDALLAAAAAGALIEVVVEQVA